MKRRGLFLVGCGVACVVALASCRAGERDLPPPDARRPTLKTEAELSAEREQRIRNGEVVPSPTPLVQAERERLAATSRPRPIRPSQESIRSDILMVNKSVLTVAEALYPLRQWIEETRQTQTLRGFYEQARRRIRDHVRQEIGSLLVHEKAIAALSDPQLAALDEAVDREIDMQISRDFGDSRARLENHLERHGLTLERFRELIKRQMVVNGYMREMLMPQVQIRRDELLAYYRSNQKQYCTDETREFRMIALPFKRFLPAGVTWERASPTVRAQARLQALRRVREAYEALKERDSADVAGEFSLGVHARDGGSWGPIGQPLQPPYDDLSRRIFEFDAGRYSEPIETEQGWYIVQCGEIRPATTTPFTEVQEQIRAGLETERFNKLAGDHIWRLAERATISDLDGFINHAVERAAAWFERPERD